MFPITEIEALADNSTSISSGKTLLFDFTTGEFILENGNIQVVEGIDALKIWIQKILKTEKLKFKIYNTGELNEYGTTILELINSGYPRDFIESEIIREITESLLSNSDISNVYNFNFSRDKRSLVVNFSIDSIYGTSENEVMF